MSRDAEFTDFVTARRSHLLRIALALTGDRHRAEDLLQTALVKLYVAWSRARNPEAYVRTTMVRANVDESRRPWRRETSTDALPEAATSDPEPGDGGLFAALQALPPMQRKVIVLRHWLDLSVARTAEELGISEGAVKTHSHRAVAALRGSRSLSDVSD
ncbi:SigE family RNA polymerase sigma factor [Nocardioides aestuarii]|uniref:SigE family RNA polymerase sigma factor n=1 Tax=Nocardioides aestuarii TaxID=252231 RepID=A0ABW4TJI7_9ACTN